MEGKHYFRQRHVYIVYEFASCRREVLVAPAKIYRNYDELKKDLAAVFPTSRSLLKYIRNHCQKTSKHRPRTPAGVPRCRRECLHIQRTRIDCPVFTRYATKKETETKMCETKTPETKESKLDFPVDEL